MYVKFVTYVKLHLCNYVTLLVNYYLSTKLYMYSVSVISYKIDKILFKKQFSYISYLFSFELLLDIVLNIIKT